MFEYAAQRFMGWKLRHKNSSVEVIAFLKAGAWWKVGSPGTVTLGRDWFWQGAG